MIKLDVQKKLNGAQGELLLDIHLNIEPGEVFALYGNSGAGKTTLLRMIAGLSQPDQGTVICDTQHWYNSDKKISVTPQNRDVALVFQDFALFPNMTVEENLMYAAKGRSSKEFVERVIETLELGSLRYHKPVQLSGGQKQRTALGRAIVKKPRVLLLDEPLSSLDLGLREKLQNFILSVHKELGLTTVLVSHDSAEVQNLATRVGRLEGGRLVAVGSPAEVLQRDHFVGEIIEVKKEDGRTKVTLVFEDENPALTTSSQEGNKIFCRFSP